MQSWTQVYTPVAGNLALSTLVAVVPVAVLLGLLAFAHVRAHWAAALGLLSCVLVACGVYGMPLKLAVATAVFGAAYGLFPIGWIVLNAIFLYDVTVRAGKFEVVKTTVAGLARDRRLQALLIAFSFGAFIEGAAGFGTPVAISGAMLMALGFRPLSAATLALIGNTAPVAYGALGTPLIALASVTGLPLSALSAMAGRQLPFFSVLVPFWLIWVMAGWRRMLEVWPACLTAGLSFAIAQYVVSNFHGPWIVDIVGALVSMLALVVLLRFWKPANEWTFEHDADAPVAATVTYTSREKLQAWMPWLLLSVFVFAWGLPQVRTLLNGGTKEAPNWLNGFSLLTFPVPFLHQAVWRSPPVVAVPTAEAAVFNFNWLSATGTSLLLAGVVSARLLGFSLLDTARIFGGTLRRASVSLVTIATMLALGYSTRYAGLDATLGLAMASTGVLFPFFSPLLGWLGVALTGSDTSSNVLFGGLQQITAQQVGISPILAAASNSTGGVMGKMIDAQSIVVAGVATGQKGGEGTILRAVFWHSIALACLVGLLVLVQAYVVPGMVPVP
jgi:lactate permease